MFADSHDPGRFELFSSAQLHIDLDDTWDNISHYRVSFKSFDSLLRDHTADAVVKTWPKPLTIEFLEEQYSRWAGDLTAVCWEAREVRELGGGGAAGGNIGQNSQAAGADGMGMNSSALSGRDDDGGPL
jgi:hypothetical protein